MWKRLAAAATTAVPWTSSSVGLMVPVPDPHQRRAPEGALCGPAGPAPPGRWGTALPGSRRRCSPRSLGSGAARFCAGIGPGLRPVACTQLVDVDGALPV